MTLKATYLGSNGWIVELKHIKIIIDPWLKGDLVFPLGEWFFKGTLKDDIPMPKNVDLIILTQGLPDHCHIPTLKQFPKDTKIICPKSAYKLLKDLNFKFINTLEPQQTINIKDIEIEATAGAPVPQTENGYIIKINNRSFYIEPHGFFDNKIKPRKLDFVITPTKNLELPLVGAFIKGLDVIPDLVKTFNPKYILSSTTGGDAKFSGFLNRFISLENYTNDINSKVIELKKMESMEI